MIFTIPSLFGPTETKTINLNVVADQVVLTGDYEASCDLRSVQDRLNQMALGKHLCEPLLSFQEGGKTLLIKREEIVFAETVKQPNGYMSTKTYVQQIEFSLATAREFFGAKKLTPGLPEFADRRLESALRQCLGAVDGICIGSAGQGAVAVRWKHRAFSYKNMRFGRGTLVAPDSEWSESVVAVKSLGGWAKAISFCSYLLSLEMQDRPHNQMLTYGKAIPKNWDLMGKDEDFLKEALSLANSLEV